MTQAGTINLGGSAQSKQGGSPWAALALSLGLVLAMVGAAWFASNASLVGGTAAKPAADRSYDQIEAQRGAAAVSAAVPIEDRAEYLNGVLDRAHAAQYAGGAALSTDKYLNGILDRAHAAPYAGGADAVPASPTSGTFHATPLVVSPAAVPASPTSGTFHAGKDQLMAEAKRDRVGGP